MLTINPNEEKTIGFVVEINGVGCEEMTGHVRFAFEGVEYGFPVHFDGDQILATIKPLNKLFEGKLKNGTILEARLDLASLNHNYYFNPWSDEIQVKMPVSVEAKIIEDGGGVKRPSVSVKAKPISERKKPVKGPKGPKNGKWNMRKLENITEKDIIKYMERAGTKNKTIQQIVLNEASSSALEKGYKGNVGVLREVVRALKKPK
jgi:hypothetical protein